MDQRGEHGVDDVERAGLIGGDCGMIGGRAVAAMCETGEAGAALDDVVVRGLAGIGAVAAVAERATVDQSRIERVHGLPREAEAVECILAHVVDQHVARLHEAPQDLLALLLLEVERDRVLVAVVVDVERAEPRARRRGRVAVHITIDGLDLDHLRAEVAEDLGRQRAQHDGGDIDDPEAGEQRVHGARRSLVLVLTAEKHICRGRYAVGRGAAPVDGFAMRNARLASLHEAHLEGGHEASPRSFNPGLSSTSSRTRRAPSCGRSTTRDRGIRRPEFR